MSGKNGREGHLKMSTLINRGTGKMESQSLELDQDFKRKAAVVSSILVLLLVATVIALRGYETKAENAYKLSPAVTYQYTVKPYPDRIRLDLSQPKESGKGQYKKILLTVAGRPTMELTGSIYETPTKLILEYTPTGNGSEIKAYIQDSNYYFRQDKPLMFRKGAMALLTGLTKDALKQ